MAMTPVDVDGTPASPPAAESITDDEFERLLDELHGAAKPGGPAVGETVRAPEPSSASGNDSVTVHLEPTAQIADVRTLYDHLSALIEEPDEVTIDASQVETVDTAILQTIFVFMHERAHYARETRLFSPSEGFLRVVRLLDLGDGLGVNAG